MFLIALLLMILVVAYTLFNPSPFSITISVIMVAYTIIVAFVTGDENTPLIKVSNPRVEIEKSTNRVSKVVTAKTPKTVPVSKAVCIDVLNKTQNAELVEGKATIETKSGKWDIENLNLIPDAQKSVRLFRVLRNEPFISPYQNNKVKLNWGESYDFDLRFYGKNFVNKKVWRLELDLTSWDSCNLRFKTRREVLKEKIGGGKDE